jgi:hypothetical protein
MTAEFACNSPPSRRSKHLLTNSPDTPDAALPIMDTIVTEKRIDAAFRFPYYLDRSQIYINRSEAGDE